MSGSEKLNFKTKQSEADAQGTTVDGRRELPPPPYSELEGVQPRQDYGPPSSGSWGPSGGPNYNNQTQYVNQGKPYDPMNDPNVYKVAPQMVDITRANPEHLNPDYIRYQERDRQRFAQGDFPNPRSSFKHGAPLAPSKKDPTNSTGKSFPGRSGVTYKNAANNN
ncbi:uncharacterized protein PRCAT00000736001 [Priceomyces carsonii]|uniref:uncharacterized protein n=1 Tax=Priceomyces carsonii TaxID=28549 RepID=UPI002ED79A71|nr:unnamed protein product [Priceomyces carsonii]